MRTHDVPGFVLRTDAVEQYGRSKASFIRDFDKAFARGDSAFLENVCMVLRDDSVIPGPEATKKKMQSLQAMQPWVYIRKSLLESRYWEKPEGNKAPKPRKAKQPAAKEGSGPVAKLSGVSGAVQLEHENALLRQRLESQGQTIGILEGDNKFLKDELENRRGEIEKMTQFVNAMRKGVEAAGTKAIGSGEQETTETQEDDNAVRKVVDATSMNNSEKGSGGKKIRSRVQKFVDFLNQPIGKGRKARSATNVTHAH